MEELGAEDADLDAAHDPHGDQEGVAGAEYVETEDDDATGRPATSAPNTPAVQAQQPSPPTVLAAPTLIEKVQRVAHELGLSATLPHIPNVLSQANAMFGITPAANATASAQVDALLDRI